MNNNAPAIFRSLIVYAIIVPLAIFLGYSLPSLMNRPDNSTLIYYGVLGGLLIFPLLLRWHYPLLLFSWICAANIFFLPSKPSLWLLAVAVSLTISVLERILSANRHFIRVPQMTWPLVFLLVVIFFTAKLTGGFGVKALGSSVYGGKKYIYMIAGVLSYFALTARAIPPEKARRYVGWFLLGGLTAIIGDLYPITPGPLHFIYLFFPPSGYESDSSGGFAMEIGVTRLAGIATGASVIIFWMTAQYGLRGIFLSGKVWRLLVIAPCFMLIFFGGFRSLIIMVGLIVVIQFFLEGLHRSKLMLPFVMAGITLMVLLVPLASHLPYTVQRSLAFLPVDIDPQARLDAEGSSNWRLQMWQALLPQIPQHLLLGKGFTFSPEEYNEMMGNESGAAVLGNHVINAADTPLALSGDYHSGPLSTVLCFGIWGVIALLWLWAASLRVMYQNYKYGDPALHTINLFLFTDLIVKCFGFLFLSGGINDVSWVCGLVGLSVALNNGVCRPVPEIVPVKPAVMARSFSRPRPAFQR